MSPSSAAGSNFVNLVVNGHSISATPAPNTNIALAGLGHVILNEQISSSKPGFASLTVNMIHVFITVQNVLNIPVGTQIIVADASSGLTVVGGPAALDGFAFGTSVNVANVIRSTPTAPVSVPCLGTNGVLLTNSVVSVSVPPDVVSGTVTDTARGSVTGSLSMSETTSTVQAVNLLNATVTANLIKADAKASTPDGTNFTFSDSGSQFVNLHVAGHSSIGDNVPPNTQVSLAGLGTLWLHRVIKTNNSIEVRMIEIVVTQANVLNVPIGTDIRVADAEASLHSNERP